MSRTIAIDLGTTYSAAAVASAQSGDGFFVLPGCSGHAVILDRLKRRTTPSVVAEDGAGEIVVGWSAKGRAGLSPEPIMFAKRWMGEEKVFYLRKQGDLHPEDVAMHMLAYLKQMAETRLGHPVDEAVITVPAYFSLRARQLTERAAERAGLRVVQIAQEPIAAAMMYCAGDPRDTMKIFTYDLGGGTFDVSILEKREGAISSDSIRAFDGDRFLGGYNFDKQIAEWMLERLNEQGYRLDLDLRNPAHNVIFAKLMVYAERAKIELSKSEFCQIQEPNSGIQDLSGNSVEIVLELTRDQFETMIRNEVDYTIDICQRMMAEKANPPIQPTDIDEIIMVGGSARIPLVSRRLEELFGRKPRLVEPDLCVALGASILAASHGTSYGCLQLDTIPRQTAAPYITVTGQIHESESHHDVGDCTVRLRATDGSYQNSRTTSEEGRFAFDQVLLTEETETEFIISATSAQGEDLASHRFSVLQTATPEDGDVIDPVTNVLSKPIRIKHVGGLEVIAPERTPLPFNAAPVRAKTTDTSGTIRIPIYEENTPVGEIVLADVPPELGVGNAVEITVEIDKDYHLHGRAYVPSLDRRASVTIEIPVPRQRSKRELEREYDLLAARAEDAESIAGVGVLFGDAKIKRLHKELARCREMLNSKTADLPRIQQSLYDIEGLIDAISGGWKPDPSRDVFERKAKETRQLASQLVSRNPDLARHGFDKQIETIRADADKAYADQDSAAWRQSYAALERLGERLEELNQGDERAQAAPQDPATLLFLLERDLENLEKHAKAIGRYDEWAGTFENLASSLRQIDPQRSDAMFLIRDWYTQFSDLRRKLGGPTPNTDPGLVELDPERM